MRILRVETPRVKIDLPDRGDRSNNKIDILTGRNGCGKTEILTSIVYEIANFDESTYDPFVRIDTRPGLPPAGFERIGEKVIAQTFSPFNRFPRPIRNERSLASIYSDGDKSAENYYCLGLYKGTGFGGSGVTRRLLEEAMYRISESPEALKSVFSMLPDIGFQDFMTLHYRTPPQFRMAVKKSDLEKFLSERSKRQVGAPIRAEMEHASISQIADLVSEATKIIGLELERPIFERKFSAFDSHRNYSELQSLLLLRRLNLLGLTNIWVKSHHGINIDVANASSGQQQMLCSFFGLSSALQDGAVVVIDEPELSLHPRWQQTYLDNLLTTLRTVKGCHVLIATHSPLIVQRAQNLGINVHHVGGKDDELFVSTSKTASVEGTLIDVFETPVVGSAHLANELFTIVTAAEQGTPEERSAKIQHLQNLQDVYTNAQVVDQKSLDLIIKALAILGVHGDENVRI